jgi:hypothetical protein
MQELDGRQNLKALTFFGVCVLIPLQVSGRMLWITLTFRTGDTYNKSSLSFLLYRDGMPYPQKSTTRAYYDYCISSGRLEGTNNKIKTMKRMGYGFRDMECFKSKIMPLHEAKHILIG